MKSIQYLGSTLLIICFLCSSCSKDDIDICDDLSLNRIQLAALSTGQQNRYIGFDAEDYWESEESSFDYTYRTDTLIVEIIGENSNGFIFTEYLSSGSFSLNNEDTPLYNADSIYTYTAQLLNGKFVITEPSSNSDYSHLFHRGIQGFNLPLDKIQENKTEMKGWKTTLPYCECYLEAYTDAFSWCEENTHLNIIIANEWMQVDGPGNTYFFSEETGIVQTSVYSWWTGTGQGWELIRD